MEQTELEERSTSLNHFQCLGRWHLAAAQKRGTSHEASGEGCQDAYSVAMLSSEVLVIAIADGAGSAKYAQVGASLASNRSIGQVCADLAKAGNSLDEVTLEDILYKAVVAARDAVEAEAGARQVSSHDLATTLILMIAKKEFIAVAQIGDGATVIADEAGKIMGLSLPPLAEYINETTFLTSAEALRTMQVKIWRGRATRLAAFSDGLQMLCLKWPERLPFEAFFSPLFHYLATNPDELQAEQDLARFLSSEKISELTDDDLTLVLASFTDCPNEC